MKYLVMETHPAYAVVLDERGRFLKAANLHYQVGQTVQDVVELRLPPPRRRFRPAWGALGALALAACLCLGFFGYWQPNLSLMGRCASRSIPMWSFRSAKRTACWTCGLSMLTARRCWTAWT